MSFVKPLLLFMGLFTIVHGFVFGSNTDTKIANSVAKILNPLSIENTDMQGLEFGVVALGSANSIVRVSPTSTVSPNVAQGDAAILNAVTQKAAKFTVTGEIGSNYIVNLPSSMLVLNGTHSLTINNFTCSNNGSGVISASTIFYVGADLNIPNDAIVGSYQGTFSVVVSYN